MSTEPTLLRNIMLVGAPLIGSTEKTPLQSAFIWAAQVQVAYQGRERTDKSVANSTLGLRVMLQSVASEVGLEGVAGEFKNVRLHTPQLLAVSAHPHTAGFVHELYFASAPGKPVAQGKYSIWPEGWSSHSPDTGMASLAVTPVSKWPMPQKTTEIEVPWLRLAAGDMSVLVDVTQAKATALGFLGLVLDTSLGQGKERVLAFGAPQLPLARTTPHVLMQPEKREGRFFVKFDLVPEGIAFDAKIANPKIAFDASAQAQEWISVRLLLTQKKDAKKSDQGVWVLKLVPEIRGDATGGYPEINDALYVFRSTMLNPASGLEVDFDCTRALPPVSLPLQLVDNRLCLLASGSRNAWILDVDPMASRVALCGDRMVTGELPTIVNVTPDRVRISFDDAQGLPATTRVSVISDRRRQENAPTVETVDPSKIEGPRLELSITSGKRTFEILANQASPDGSRALQWFWDEGALSRRLLARYQAAQVQPLNQDWTYAFFPISGGWLQWPLALNLGGASEVDSSFPGYANADRPAGASLGGLVEYEWRSSTDAATSGGVSNARIALFGCDYLSGEFTLEKPKQDLVAAKVNIRIFGAEGRTNGLLWYSSASPSLDESLPSFRAGAMSLETSWLNFGRESTEKKGMRILESDNLKDLNQGLPSLDLSSVAPKKPEKFGERLPRVIAWVSSSGIPTVTAMPMTRASESNTYPSETRHLVPRQIDLQELGVRLTFQAGRWLPALSTPLLASQAPSGATSASLLPLFDISDSDNEPALAEEISPWVPLVAVTLPGIEFRPSWTDQGNHHYRLRYDLPILDELFATATIPEPSSSGRPTKLTKGKEEGATPGMPVVNAIPTALDLVALRRLWQTRQDRLMLSRVESSVAGSTWMDTSFGNPKRLELGEVLEGASWKTDISLKREVSWKADQTGSVHYFGSYFLSDVPGTPGNTEYFGNQALAGLTASFSVQGIDLVSPTTSPLSVIGFAAGLWKTQLSNTGSAAYRDTRRLITAQRPEAKLAGQLVLRQSGYANDPTTWWRGTLRKPVPIVYPAAAKWRALAFWFCDLPLIAVPPDLQGSNPQTLNFSTNTITRGLGQQEVALGPQQTVFDGKVLPGASYEWRLCNDEVPPDPPSAGANSSTPQPLYDIDLGVMRFRPLRLLHVTLESELSGADSQSVMYVTKVQLLGSMSPDLQLKSPDAAFGPDRITDSSNPVVLEILADAADNTQLSLASSRWLPAHFDPDLQTWSVVEDSKATVNFYLPEIRIDFGIAANGGGSARRNPKGSWNSSSGWLQLTIGSQGRADGRPNIESAQLRVRLFGCNIDLDKAKISYTNDGQDLEIAFDLSTTPVEPDTTPDVSGFVLTQVVLSNLAISKADITDVPQMRIHGALQVPWEFEQPTKIAQVRQTTPCLIRASFPVDKPRKLSWLNVDENQFVIDVDHYRGALVLDAKWTAEGHTEANPVGVWEPVGGMRIAKLGYARLRVVFMDARDQDGAIFMAASAYGKLLLKEPATKPETQVTLPAKVQVIKLLHLIKLTPALDKVDPGIDSKIYLDLQGKRVQSKVRWPVSGIKVDGKDLSVLKPEERRTLAEGASGRAIEGQLASGNRPLGHWFSFLVKDVELPMGNLVMQSYDRTDATKPESQVLELFYPWSLQVLMQHGVWWADENLPSEHLGWQSIEQVVAIGARSLRLQSKLELDPKISTKEQRAFGFSARYVSAKATMDTPLSPDPTLAKAGLQLRAFANAGFPVKAIAEDLVKFDNPLKDSWVESWVLSGSGPSVFENPLRPGEGHLLSLPWIATLGGDTSSQSIKLPTFEQIGQAHSNRWRAPDVDWYSGEAIQISTDSAASLALTSSRSRELGKALGTLMGGEQKKSDVPSPLMSVEQVFIEGPLKVVQLGNVATSAQRPLWLRSLMALASIWNRFVANPGAYAKPTVRSIVPSGFADGRFVDIAIAPSLIMTELVRSQDEVKASYDIQVLGRTDVFPKRFDATDAARISVDDNYQRMRALAEQLVHDPILVLIEEPDDDGVPFGSDLFRTNRDDPAYFIRRPFKETRPKVFASPALGWPTRIGTDLASTGSMGMGEDQPFQDVGEDTVPKNDEDRGVHLVNSGLSGRSANLVLPHRALAESALAETEISNVVYFALSTKTVFDRENVPLNANPSWSLNASQSRVRLPSSAALKAALGVVSQDGKYAPIVLPHLERTTFGYRPGVIHAEFDALLFSGPAIGDPNLIKDAPMFGRAGHAGPVIVRQTRTPRSVALPRIALRLASSGALGPISPIFISHGRRTFVAYDDTLDRVKPRPFRWYEGAAVVVRSPTTIDDGNLTGGASLHFRIKENEIDSALTPGSGDKDNSWSVQIHVLSPSIVPSAIKGELEKVGLLGAAPDTTAKAALLVDTEPFYFATLAYAEIGIENVPVLTLTMTDDVAVRARDRLQIANGDTRVSVRLMCAPNASAPEELISADARVISFPMRLRPALKPSVGLRAATLAFSDPSYDRSLSGSGAFRIAIEPEQAPPNPRKSWKLALDRREYGSDTPIYLAFGALIPVVGTFDPTSSAQAKVKLELVRLFGGAKPSQNLDVIIASPEQKSKAEPLSKMESNKSYVVALDSLRSKERGSSTGEPWLPMEFDNGDLLTLTISPVTPSQFPTMRVQVRLLAKPLVPPPSAVYSLVCSNPGNPNEGNPPLTQVVLHASGPIPQRIEHPQLLADLAIGYISRQAQFTWNVVLAPDVPIGHATLIKVDRSGGGQLPDSAGDVFALE